MEDCFHHWIIQTDIVTFYLTIAWYKLAIASTCSAYQNRGELISSDYRQFDFTDTI